MPNKTIIVNHLIRPEHEGPLASAMAAYGLTEIEFFQQAAAFILDRVASGLPVEASLQSSLQSSEISRRALSERVARSLCLAEKSLTDQAAITAALLTAVRTGKTD